VQEERVLNIRAIIDVIEYQLEQLEGYLGDREGPLDARTVSLICLRNELHDTAAMLASRCRNLDDGDDSRSDSFINRLDS